MNTVKKKNRRISIDQAAAALQKTFGNVMLAARELGISRTTLYNKINTSDRLRVIVTDGREEIIDIAESALRSRLTQGDTTAIIFTLKTLGKERGYVERQEITTGKDGIRIVHEYPDGQVAVPVPPPTRNHRQPGEVQGDSNGQEVG